MENNISLKILRILMVALIILLVSQLVFGQFNTSGELRPRTEYRHGYKSPTDTNQQYAVFTDQRTRLKFEYFNENIRFGVSLQDVRTWGSEAQLNLSDGLLSIHEAWGEIFFNKKLSLKTGRQELVYDDQRIFGSVDWVQQARSHDITLLKYENTFKVHLGLAYNQDKSQLTTNVYTIANYKAMQFVWFNKPVKNFNLSFILLNNGLQGSKTTTTITQIDSTTFDTTVNTTYHINYSQTFGPRVSYKKNKIDANAAFYYQMGKVGTSTGKDMKGFDFQIDASYTLFDKINTTIGFEMLSGNNQTDTTSNYKNIEHAFSPLYGTNHKFNGHMDYFYVGNHSGSVGLQDIFYKMIYKQVKYEIGIDVHYFLSASHVLDTKEFAKSGKYVGMSSSLGQEIDLYADYTISKIAVIRVGYSQMFSTKTMTTIKSGSTDEISNWGWLMIVIKPQFLINEKG